MAGHPDIQGARRARAQQIGLFRYALIRPALEAGLSTRQRGALVRELAGREHAGPFGQRVRLSRNTIDRWIRHWRAGGFDALVPRERQVAPRTEAAVLELAIALKKENPSRTAAQVARILGEQLGDPGRVPATRTLQTHFARQELNTRPTGQPPAAFGRFEADRIGEIWVCDVLHGPKINGRRTYLIAILDDRSRLIVGARFCLRENVIALADVLFRALQSRGIPQIFYADNGACYSDAWLARACAMLGIKLVHSAPGRPQGRGKIERLFETIRHQFLVEITTAADDSSDTGRHRITTIEELNTLLHAWIARVYHRTIHSETGQSPLDRWTDGDPPTPPLPAALAEAFKWRESRTVRKSATVELHGNLYQVDPFLVGRRVELIFNPFDLQAVTVAWQGRDIGIARPYQIGRHAHPKALPDSIATPAPAPTGIDYLALLEHHHREHYQQRLDLSRLADDPGAPDDQPAQHATGEPS